MLLCLFFPVLDTVELTLEVGFIRSFKFKFLRARRNCHCGRGD